jgi:hypothetical protein
MRRFVFAVLFLSSFIAGAQDSLKGRNDTMKPSVSLSLADSLDKLRNDSIFNETMEQNSRNLDHFLQLKKEQDARQKRGALIRIGIGIALLIVMIFGLRRKIKKKGAN